MLEGKLVRLRALEPSDLEANYVWFNDREVTHFLAARYPISHGDEERWLARVGGEENGFANGVHLAIETKDGRHIGNVGLFEVQAENRRAELGIVIGDKSCWSNGYGTDAILTLLRFAFHQMNLNRVALGTFEFNERAIACYRKCGFVEEGRSRQVYFQDGRYWDAVPMAILRDEFEALHGEAVREPTAS